MDNADEEDQLPFIHIAAVTANVTRYLLERSEHHQKYRERKTARQRRDEDAPEGDANNVDGDLKKRTAT